MFDLFNQKAPAKELKLHWYQEHAIDLARQSFGRGKQRPCLSLPTGAGKTVIAGSIANMALRKNNRVAFIVPFKALLGQTAQSFNNIGVPSAVFHYEHELDIDAPVQIMTAQTMASCLRKGRAIPEFDFGIYDEAHQTQAVIRQMMLEGGRKWLGLTATPWTVGMGQIYDDLLQPVSIGRLIDEGYLCPFVAYAPSKPDLSGVNVVAGEYNQKQAGDVMSEQSLVADIVTTWMMQGEDRPTLAFCVNKAHAEHLCNQFNRAGVPAAFVVAETDQIERDLIGKQFAEGQIKVVCNVRTLTTGVDWPVACVIDAAPTKSEALHCLDAETEILTSEGWKGMGQIAEGDCVASCVGVDQGQGQWALVTGTIQRPMDACESWVEYDSVHANFRVTGDHRMIFATGQRDMRFGSALEVAAKSDGAKVPSAVTISQPGVPLSADELWLIGMFMADGTFNERSQQVSISQSERHPDIVARIDATLRRLGVSHRKSPVGKPKQGGIPERHRRWRWNISIGSPRTKVGVGRFAPHPDSIRFDGHRGLRWLMPWMDKDMALGLLAMSAEQMKAFLQGLWDGDGSKKKGVDYTPKTQQILTVRPVLADRLQALGAINGYTVNMRHYDPKGRARQYFLSFKRQDWRHIGGTGRKPCFSVTPATAEDVWCVETTTGTIVTRRRGKVTVMGNCQKIGRGLRVNPPWRDCLILDHAGNSLTLGLVTDIHHDSLNSKDKPDSTSTERKKAEPKECSKCQVIKPAGARICPVCGHEAKPPCTVEVEDGELVQISGKAKKPKKMDKQKFWSMALHVDKQRDKGGKLAKALYKGKFGVWPKGLDHTPIPPDTEFLGYERSRRIAYAKSKGGQR